MKSNIQIIKINWLLIIIFYIMLSINKLSLIIIILIININLKYYIIIKIGNNNTKYLNNNVIMNI